MRVAVLNHSVSRFNRTTGWKVRGAMFQDGPKSAMTGTWIAKSSAIFCLSERRAYRPHISEMLLPGYFQLTAACETLDSWLMHRNGMAKVYRRAKFGDISIKGTVKEHEMKLRRQQFARRNAEAAIAVAEIEAARFARLPWPVRAIGAVLDFILRRP